LFIAVNHVCARLGLLTCVPGLFRNQSSREPLAISSCPGPLQGLQRRCKAVASPDSRCLCGDELRTSNVSAALVFDVSWSSVEIIIVSCVPPGSRVSCPAGRRAIFARLRGFHVVGWSGVRCFVAYPYRLAESSGRPRARNFNEHDYCVSVSRALPRCAFGKRLRSRANPRCGCCSSLNFRLELPVIGPGLRLAWCFFVLHIVFFSAR